MEFDNSLNNAGFKKVKSFCTKIRFPRPLDERYLKLLDVTDNQIVDSYEIEIIKENIFATLKVVNLIYIKSGK